MNPERIATLESRIQALHALEPSIGRDIRLKLAEADLDFERRYPRTDYRLPERRKQNTESELT